MSKYEYTPLCDSTAMRLVVILPGEEADSLNCLLYTYRNGEVPPYRALSYVWGDEPEDAKKQQIFFNFKALSVTTNLRNALQNLRPASGAEGAKLLPLWIDAICIDQNNLNERNEQVGRMQSVYANATQVLIWLGCYSEACDVTADDKLVDWGVDHFEPGSEELTRLALKIAKSLSFHFHLTLVLSSFGESEDKIKAADEELESFFGTDPGKNIQAWHQLSRIFRRPWFERLWVIQELWASKVVGTQGQNAMAQCGQIKFHWTDLHGAAKCLTNLRLIRGPRLEGTYKMFPLMSSHRVLHIAQPMEKNYDFWTILSRTKHSACSDPHDRLYAIVGLLQNEDKEDIQIDYSSSVEASYRQWALRRIQRTQSLDVFSACTDFGRFEGGSSWVPELRSEWGRDKYLFDRTRYSLTATNDLRKDQSPEADQQIPWYAALGMSGFRASVSEDLLTLSLNGIRTGRIAALSFEADIRTKGLEDVPTSLLEIVKKWEAFTREHLNHAQEDGFYKSAAFFTYVDVVSRGYMSYKEVEFSAKVTEHYMAWRRIEAASLDLPSELPEAHHRTSLLTTFEVIVLNLVLDCQIFVTDEGDLGIVGADCHAQIGDEVCILNGGVTPFILREQGLNHRLISPCYVSGYMRGETVKEVDNGRRKMETITLI